MALIPDELVLKTNLIGTKERVRQRLRVHQQAGVTTLHVAPEGNTLEERLTTLGQLIELVNQVNAEAAEKNTLKKTPQETVGNTDC